MKSAAERKAFVIKAFDTLFNKRDYKAAEAYWSPKYIQHSAHIPPGREGLFELVKSLPAELHYEHGLVVAEGDFVFLHSRVSGIAPRALITVDIVRLADGVLAEPFSQNIGTFGRTKSPRTSQRVANLCSGKNSRANALSCDHPSAEHALGQRADDRGSLRQLDPVAVRVKNHGDAGDIA